MILRWKCHKAAVWYCCALTCGAICVTDNEGRDELLRSVPSAAQKRPYTIDQVLHEYAALACEVYREKKDIRGFVRTTFVILARDGACRIVVANPDEEACGSVTTTIEERNVTRFDNAEQTVSEAFGECEAVARYTKEREWAAIVNKQDKVMAGASAVSKFMAERACLVPTMSLGGSSLPCVMPNAFRDIFNGHYEEWTKILDAKPPIDEESFSSLSPIVFWRGKTGKQTGTDRNAMIRFSQSCHDCFIDAKVVLSVRGYTPSDLVATTFADLDEWLENKYLVDVDGFGYSSSLVWKLKAQRPIFRIESSRNLTVWYDYFLEPWVHYVPMIPEDWDDTKKSFDLLQAKPQKALEIARNARRIACILEEKSFAAELMVATIDAKFTLVSEGHDASTKGDTQPGALLISISTIPFDSN